MVYEGLLVTMLLTGSAWVESQAAGASARATGIAEFHERARAFAQLHQRLAREVGELDETKSQREIAERATRLAQALQAARPGVKPGNIFTPRAARVFRDLIRREYRRRTPAVKQSREDAQDEVPDFVPRVNTLYPTTFPLGTFPASLLKVLPELPPQLEYRIVTHHLILRDIEANLIIDVLPNAIR